MWTPSTCTSTTTSSASPKVVFKSFVGEDNVGMSPSQFDVSRNMNSDMMNGARNSPRLPIMELTCVSSHETRISTTFCQPVGIILRFRVASHEIRMTIAIVSQVMQRVSQLNVNPAKCTTSRTPISCITYTSLLGKTQIIFYRGSCGSAGTGRVHSRRENRAP